jgi:hypothetical protein
MTDHYDEMSVPPDPSLAEALRQRLHARMASASRDDHEGRSHLQHGVLRLEPPEHFVPTEENYVTVDSPTSERTNRGESTNRRRMGMVAAAVVVVIGVAGIALAIDNTSDDDDDEAPSPAVQPTVAPTTVAPTTVAPTTVPPHRETGVFVEGGGDNGVPVTYTVPFGWRSDGAGVTKGAPSSGVIFVNVGNIYTNSCPSMPLDPPVGPTVDDLVSAWANLPGFDATDASDVTVDGFHGKQIEFTVPGNDADCQRYLVQEKDSGNPTFPAISTQQVKALIIDVDGTRLVILALSFPHTSTQDQATIEEILASVQIG